MQHTIKLWITGKAYRTWKGKEATKVGRAVMTFLRYSGKSLSEIVEKAKAYCSDIVAYYERLGCNSDDFVWQIGDEHWYIGKDLTQLPARPWTPRKPWTK